MGQMYIQSLREVVQAVPAMYIPAVIAKKHIIIRRFYRIFAL